MSERPPIPLEPELDALFDAERRFPAASAASRARVWSKLETAMLPVPPGGGGGDGGAAAAPSAATTVAVARDTGLVTFAKAAAIFLAGGLSGAMLERAVNEPAEPVIIQLPPSAAAVPLEPAPEPVVEQLAAVEPSAAAETATGKPRVAQSARSEPVRDGSQDSEGATVSALSRERAMIDAARSGIARGHPEEALFALARHGREFPRGSLREEREGLTVLALLRAGRRPEAQEKAEAFRRAYPRSLLLTAIDRLLGP